jgi:hypothetical protein
VVRFTSLPPYPQGKAPGTYWIRGVVEPRADLAALENRKICPLPGIEPRPSSPQLYRLSYPGFLEQKSNYQCSFCFGVDTPCVCGRCCRCIQARCAWIGQFLTQKLTNLHTQILKTKAAFTSEISATSSRTTRCNKPRNRISTNNYPERLKFHKKVIASITSYLSLPYQI